MADTPPRPEDERPRSPCPVLAVVCTRRELDALRAVVTALPRLERACCAVLLHDVPDDATPPPELRDGVGDLRVTTAEPGLSLAAGRLYVATLARPVGFRAGAFAELGDRADAVDEFFATLADEHGARAVGIALGAAAVGRRGLRALRSAGGLAVAVGRGGSGMAPESDLATDASDLPALLREHHDDHCAAPALDARLEDATLRQILTLVHRHSGQDFAGYKPATLCRRIARRIDALQLDDAAAYVERLEADPDELELLHRELLIGVTAFFRDPHVWEELSLHGLPERLRTTPEHDAFRVWVPGCASGEEAYTVAILVHETMQHLGIHRDLQIFATDIDQRALARGRAGSYSAEALDGLNAARRARWLERDGDDYRMVGALRDAVTFSKQNLLVDPPFSRVDLISCRNLLIYLEPEVQARVTRILHFALRPGGLLLLGPSETPRTPRGWFRGIAPAARILRRQDVSPQERLRLPLPLRRSAPPAAQHPARAARPRRPRRPGDELRDAVIHELGVAAVLVDADHRVLHYLGPTSRFLQPPDGDPTDDLAALLRHGLVTRVRGALTEAARTGDVVRDRSARVRRGGHYEAVRLHVVPIEDGTEQPTRFAVCFLDAPESASAAAASGTGHGESDTGATDPVVRQLEQELQTTRRELQHAVQGMEASYEDLEASHEELVSLNEELQASNEELETSKEELQALNEELGTVNQELQEKVTHLQRAHDDLGNLIRTTDIAAVFLDAELRVRRFTPAAQRLIHLREGDVGRALQDFALRFEDNTLLDDLRSVLVDRQPRRKEIPGRDGAWYERRIQPYVDHDGQCHGLMLDFVDVTAARELRNRLQAYGQELDELVDARTREIHALLRNGPDLIERFDRELRYVYVNERVLEVTGLTREQCLGATRLELGFPPSLCELWDSSLRECFESGSQVIRRFRHMGRSGLRDYEARLVPEFDDEGRTVTVMAATRDVTADEQRRRELEHAHARLEDSLDSIDWGLVSLDRELRLLHLNAPARRTAGQEHPAIGRPLFESFPEAAGSVFERRYWRVLETGRAETFDAWLQTTNWTDWYRCRVFPTRAGLDVYFRVVTAEKERDARIRQDHDRRTQAERLDALARLAGGLAHDLNNLLVGVLGSASLLTAELRDGSDLREDAERIIDSARQAAQLANRMLAYAGRATLRSTRAELTALAERVAGDVAAGTDAGPEIHCELPDPPLVVEADTAQLEDALRQLLSNALEASESTVDPVRVTLRHTTLDADAVAALDSPTPCRPGDYAVIDVHDRGAGMSAEIRRLAWDPFFSTRGTGRGIGLATVLGCARAHHGAVAIDSQPEFGTTASLYVPLAAEPATAGAGGARPGREPEDAGIGGRVLLVDDDATVRTIAERALRRAGAEPLVFASAPAALAAITGDDAPLTAAVIDVTLPELGGLGLLRRLREVRPDLPTVMISGSDVPLALGELPVDEAVARLQKPFDHRALLAAVRAAIRGRPPTPE